MSEKPSREEIDEYNRQHGHFTLDIDWFELAGFQCPFCGGDIDHLHQEDDEEGGYSDDSYKCEEKNGALCEYAYMMVRWSRTERGHDGDALTLKHWVEIEGLKAYVNKPDEPEATIEEESGGE